MSLNKIIENNNGIKSYGKYNERNPYSMANSPKNEDESRDYANALYSSGYYPAGLKGCFTVGISGGCCGDCWVFQEGKCENPIDVIIDHKVNDEDILILYDNGYYEEEIREYFKENNKEYILQNREEKKEIKMYFNQEEHDWLKRVKEMPEKYRVIIDNDCIWIEDLDIEDFIFTFNSYGYEFIYALLNDIGINADMC